MLQELIDQLEELGAVTTKVTDESITQTVTNPAGEEVLVVCETATHRILVWQKAIS